MISDNAPAPYLHKWGSFPADAFIPEAVRPALAKLYDLRTKVADAREAEIAARARIDEVEKAQVHAAVARIAAGEDVGVDSKPVAKAQADHAQAVRDLHATQRALEMVEAELCQAYSQPANAREAERLANEATEAARAVYRDAIEALAAARRDFHEAADAQRFAKVAGLPMNHRDRRTAASYTGQRVGDSSQELAKLRAEADPPVVQVPDDLASTTFR